MRERKGMDLGCWRRENQGDVGKRETVIRIYCIKKYHSNTKNVKEGKMGEC